MIWKWLTVIKHESIRIEIPSERKGFFLFGDFTEDAEVTAEGAWRVSPFGPTQGKSR